MYAYAAALEDDMMTRLHESDRARSPGRIGEAKDTPTRPKCRECGTALCCDRSRRLGMCRVCARANPKRVTRIERVLTCGEYYTPKGLPEAIDPACGTGDCLATIEKETKNEHAE